MYIGVDYGSKRVGIAVSDDMNRMAFPLEVAARRETLSRLAALAQERRAEGFVIGESKNFAGEDNPVMSEIKAFADELRAETKLPVMFEPEFLTSAAAGREGNTAKRHLDAAAAALILQSFLDRHAAQA